MTIGKNFEISDAINSPFPMNKLHILEEYIFKLEIRLLRNKWLLANPNVAACPVKVNVDLLPLAELLARSDDAN